MQNHKASPTKVKQLETNSVQTWTQDENGNACLELKQLSSK